MSKGVMRGPPASGGRFLPKMMLLILSLSALAILFVQLVYLPQKQSFEELEANLAFLRSTDQALRKRISDLEEIVGKSTGRWKSPGSDDDRSQQVSDMEDARRITSTPSGKGVASGNPLASTSTTAVHAEPTTGKTIRWRSDLRCGKDFHDDQGVPEAQCNPQSSDPCCAPSGWCGSSISHCTCDGCVDYRSDQSAAASTTPTAGEPAEPYDERSPKNIALVVPFRDREAHLTLFQQRIESHVKAWQAKGVQHNWTVYVIEQYDTNLFNRGYLFNVGFQQAMQDAAGAGRKLDCVVMHDIDIIPEPVVDYGWCRQPIQLSGEIECWDWSAPYPVNVGGVVSLNPTHWKQINGFSNDYEGWGGEDDDLYLRLKQNSLLKGGCHTWCDKKPTAPIVMRPPLGKGRFNCLHDGDHTPRQRAPNDSAMWTRLREMQTGSKRWRTDGLTNLKVNEATPSLVQSPCQKCTAPEDPVQRMRVFAQRWSRVSPKAIRFPASVEMHLPFGHKCANQSLTLTKVPQGLDDLRRLLHTFPETCGVERRFSSKTNFVLLDLSLGQALLLGTDAGTIVPDASLPSLTSTSGHEGWVQARQKAAALGGSHMMQSQRLVRWLRALPPHHHAWILVADKPLPQIRHVFEQEERRAQLTSPVCISSAKLDGTAKYRLTPGTRWCGDNGWTNVETFDMLRSSETAPQMQLVPICIGYNPKKSTYRFEQSSRGCIGKDGDGIEWEHAQTIHTTKDAKGPIICVGKFSNGDSTRWIMSKTITKCSDKGFIASFVFRAMDPAQYVPALIEGCLLTNRSSIRMAAGRLCDEEYSSVVETHWFLRHRQNASDYRLCMAEGRREAWKPSDPSVWRIFWNEACDHKSFVSRDSSDAKISWTLTEEPNLFIPEHGTGRRICLSEVKRQGSLIYSWAPVVEGIQELCLQTLSPADALKYADLVDNVK
mmetsp:Transcript_53482/g.114370  ORF Transcript_53482/g.114370 Transcript_53482/m.114370 type:complete len:940 (-) Transcript_53482:416-3235(-)